MAQPITARFIESLWIGGGDRYHIRKGWSFIYSVQSTLSSFSKFWDQAMISLLVSGGFAPITDWHVEYHKGIEIIEKKNQWKHFLEKVSRIGCIKILMNNIARGKWNSTLRVCYLVTIWSLKSLDAPTYIAIKTYDFTT